MRRIPPILLICACAAPDPDAPLAVEEVLDPITGLPFVHLAADAYQPRGPGGPQATFSESELGVNCAFLPSDTPWEMHNLAVPWDGYLLLPAAAEWGQGSMTVFEMNDPCDPVVVGRGHAHTMRETHASGFVHLPEGDPHAGHWTAANMIGQLPDNSGVQIWNLDDPADPRHVVDVGLDGVFYPDSYVQITLHLFWAYPWIYATGSDRGLFVIDATDPTDPVVVNHLDDLDLRVGGVFALGDVLLLTSTQQSEALLLDISDPADPQPIPGGRFTLRDGDGEARRAYHGNLSGNLALFARKDAGGGAIVYDISDPSNPTYVADYHNQGMSGGYVFRQHDHLFVGNGNAAHVLDFSDLSAPRQLLELHLEGDLDTATPYGNVVILSVDEEASPGEATAVAPWRTTPEDQAPGVENIRPADGATGVATTMMIGVGLDEIIEPTSAHIGSVRLFDEDDRPVPGWVSTQEASVHFTPKEPLRPGHTYTLELPEGGLADPNGNAIQATVRARFTTRP